MALAYIVSSINTGRKEWLHVHVVFYELYPNLHINLLDLLALFPGFLNTILLEKVKNIMKSL